MWLQFLSTVISGIVIATLSAYLTVRFSLRRFYSEKWWERKADAYTNILEGLYTIARLDDAEVDNLHNEEQKFKLSEDSKQQYRTAKHELERLEYIGAFVISEDAWKCLTTYRRESRELEAALDYASYYELIESQAALTRDCLTEMRSLAVKDLRLNR